MTRRLEQRILFTGTIDPEHARCKRITDKGIKPGIRLRFDWRIFVVTTITTRWYLNLKRRDANGKVTYLSKQNPLSFTVVNDPYERDADGN